MSTLSGTTSKSQWPFSPQSIPGLQFWLDAADTSSLTVSSGSVTAWRDKSGNGYNLNALPMNQYQGQGNAIYPSVGTPINNLNTVYFSAWAGLKQGTVVNGAKNFYWVGRIASGGTTYFLMGADTTYDWHANGGPGTTILASAYAQAGLLAATPASQYTSGSNAVVNTTFSSIVYPSAGDISLLSVAGISGNTRYQGVCFDRQDHSGWTGDLAEVVIFSNDLTTAQHKQVEGYLAQKWGLQPNLPGTHPYYAALTVGSSSVLPNTISGLKLWLDGADPAGTGTPPSNGATITSWVDKSSSGNSATPTGTITATTMNGLTAINFSGSAYLTSPITSGSTAPFTIFIVENQTSTSGVIYTVATSGNGGLFLNYGGTDFLDIGGNYATRASGISLNQTYVLSIVSTSVNGGTTTLYNNGSSYLTGTTTGAFSWTTLLIGKRNVGTAQEIFSGKMAEFIVYNSALTTTQRQSIEAYLSAKWGVALPRNSQFLQLYKQPVFQRPFSPVDISGCSLWLDAADSTSITGTSPVTAWKDKSGNGAHATNTGTTITISTLNGLPAINYDGSSYLTAPVTSGVADPFSIFMIFSQAAYGAPVYSTSTSTDGNALFLNYGGTTDLLEGNGSWVSKNPSTISSNQTYLLSIVSTSVNGGTITLYVNGASYLSGTTIGAFTWTSFLIGKRTIPGYSETLTGKFGEIMVFKSALSSSQRQQVESYLAWKWGLVASLAPSPAHPGKLLPSFSTVFSPKSVSGISLWLDAADTPTVIGTSPVTQWNDKSGNDYNAYATPSGNNLSLSTINGVQAINYGGSSYLFAPFTSGAAAPFSIFIVFNQSSTAGPVFTTSTSTDGSGLFLNFGGSSTGGSTDYLSGGSTWITHGSSTINSNTTYLLSITSTSVNGGTATLYVNGTSYMSGSTTGNFSWTTLLIGKRSYGSGQENFAGKFGEFIIFNSALSPSDRQKVEGYLAWKWGLVSNLLSTHGFKNIKP